ARAPREARRPRGPAAAAATCGPRGRAPSRCRPGSIRAEPGQQAQQLEVEPDEGDEQTDGQVPSVADGSAGADRGVDRVEVQREGDGREARAEDRDADTEPARAAEAEGRAVEEH